MKTERIGYYVQAWYGDSAANSDPLIYTDGSSYQVALQCFNKLVAERKAWLVELYKGAEYAELHEGGNPDEPDDYSWYIKDGKDWHDIKTWAKIIITRQI